MLTPKGFYINQNELCAKDIEKITSDLTVRPEVYIGTADTYKLYRFVKNYVNLPRYYAIDNFIKDKNVINVNRKKISPGNKCNYQMTPPFKSLTNEQKETYPFVIKAFKQYSTCILKLPCGHGKTVLSIYMAQKIKRRTLIVVHRAHLLDQWADEIKKYTSASVGFLHRNKFEIDNDFIITTIHNVLDHGHTEKYQKAYKTISLSIFDECHHLSASEFCKTLKIINTWYMLGLTATPNKGERTRTNHVFKQFLGPIVPPENIIDFSGKVNDVQVHVVKYSIPADNPDLDKQLMIEYAGKPNTAQMVSNLSINDKRNDFIVRLIQELLNIDEEINDTEGIYGDETRKILVISDRICMLKYIHSILQMNNIFLVSSHIFLLYH
jgi:superfamily II DNA or RNA helicase